MLQLGTPPAVVVDDRRDVRLVHEPEEARLMTELLAPDPCR